MIWAKMYRLKRSDREIAKKKVDNQPTITECGLFGKFELLGM